MTIRTSNSLVVCLCLLGAALFPVAVLAADATPAAPTATAVPAATTAPATATPAATTTPAQVPGAVPTKPAAPAPLDVAVAFPQDYQAWRDWVVLNPKKRAMECPDFRKLPALGVQAVPLMIAKMQQNPDEAYPLAEVVGRITQTVFADEKYPTGKVGDMHEAAKLYVAWWTTDRKDVAARFDKLYTDWKAAKKDGENILSMDEEIYDSASMTVIKRQNSHTPFGDAFYGMRNLGIDLLPLIVTQVQAKDYNLLPLFSELTGGKSHHDGTPEKRAKFLLDWWAKNSDKWLLPAQ